MNNSPTRAIPNGKQRLSFWLLFTLTVLHLLVGGRNLLANVLTNAAALPVLHVLASKGGVSPEPVNVSFVESAILTAQALAPQSDRVPTWGYRLANLMNAPDVASKWLERIPNESLLYAHDILFDVLSTLAQSKDTSRLMELRKVFQSQKANLPIKWFSDYLLTSSIDDAVVVSILLSHDEKEQRIDTELDNHLTTILELRPQDIVGLYWQFVTQSRLGDAALAEASKRSLSTYPLTSIDPVLPELSVQICKMAGDLVDQQLWTQEQYIAALRYLLWKRPTIACLQEMIDRLDGMLPEKARDIVLQMSMELEERQKLTSVEPESTFAERYNQVFGSLPDSIHTQDILKSNQEHVIFRWFEQADGTAFNKALLVGGIDNLSAYAGNASMRIDMLWQNSQNSGLESARGGYWLWNLNTDKPEHYELTPNQNLCVSFMYKTSSGGEIAPVRVFFDNPQLVQGEQSLTATDGLWRKYSQVISNTTTQSHTVGFLVRNYGTGSIWLDDLIIVHC
jgi:hypothetical protein